MDIDIEETSSESDRKLIALQVTKRLYDELRRVAYEKDLTLSATIRYIVEKYFSEESK